MRRKMLNPYYTMVCTNCENKQGESKGKVCKACGGEMRKPGDQ
jgi:rRNA maturation endonuclease Nob1